jgi:hypothetical protein
LIVVSMSFSDRCSWTFVTPGTGLSVIEPAVCTDAFAAVVVGAAPAGLVGDDA